MMENEGTNRSMKKVSMSKDTKVCCGYMDVGTLKYVRQDLVLVSDLSLLVTYVLSIPSRWYLL